MKKLLAFVMAAAMTLSLAACGGSDDTATDDTADQAETETGSETGEVASGVEDGVLTIAMECAYAPYNWTQSDDSNGAVPIKDSTEYANGYDVMMAKKICEANGWELEVVRTDWDSLVPGVQSGIYDAVIAGQSMTADRMEQVDFAGPYYYASIVCVTKADSPYAGAAGISDLAGGSCTAQIATIWYDSMLPQIQDAKIQPAAESVSRSDGAFRRLPALLSAMTATGKTSSLAGKASRNASSRMPFIPSAVPTGSRNAAARSSRATSPARRFARHQSSSPAGAATADARPST
mgnify:CR=1 FL=1